MAPQPGLLLSLSPHHLPLDCAQCVTPCPARSSFLATGLRRGRVGLSPRQMVEGGVGVGSGEEGKDSSVEGQGRQLLSRCLSSASPDRLSPFWANMCCRGAACVWPGPSQRQLVRAAGTAASSPARLLPFAG